MLSARANEMSRAFVKEDAGGWGDPGKRYSLPERGDPGYDEAAAERDGDERLTQLAERFLR